MTVRPLQAAMASAASFSAGSALPLALVAFSPARGAAFIIPGASLICLAALGGLGAAVGGAGIARGVARVALWGVLAMGVTFALGRAFGRGIGPIAPALGDLS